MLKTFILSFLLIITCQSLAQKIEFPLEKLGPSLNPISIRILDAFEMTYKHGDIVKSIATNFKVDTDNQFKNLVYYSQENVVEAADSETLASLQKIGYDLEKIRNEIAITDFLIALDKAGKDHVKIVNYSLSDIFASGGNSAEFKEIVRIVEKYDMILVVPSGNEGSDFPHFPCGYDHEQIVCVGAGVFQTGVLLGDGILYEEYSNRGDHVDFYASGEFTELEDSGTSFAAPRVTSALGFLWGINPTFKSKEVIKSLKSFGKFVDTIKISKELNQRNGLLYVK